MADQPREISPQIIVALIGVTGVITAALLGNWDKLFPRPSAPAVAVSQPVAAGGAATGVAAASTTQPQAEASDTAAPADVAPQAGDASVPSIAGRWSSSDGYTYKIEQTGSNFHYAITKQGVPSGTGQGRIDGRTLAYTYSGSGGAGRCQGELASGDRTISGRCTDGEDGSSWPFQVDR
jgi:hypothetical protein